MLFGIKMSCCMLVCMCVSIDESVEHDFNKVRHKTQLWETNLRVRQSWVPNTFPRAYLNSEPILW